MVSWMRFLFLMHLATCVTSFIRTYYDFLFSSCCSLSWLDVSRHTSVVTSSFFFHFLSRQSQVYLGALCIILSQVHLYVFSYETCKVWKSIFRIKNYISNF